MGRAYCIASVKTSYRYGRICRGRFETRPYIIDIQSKLLPPPQADTLTSAAMNYTIAAESFDSLESSWQDLKRRLKWDIPFMLPRWLRVWWQAVGAASEFYLGS